MTVHGEPPSCWRRVAHRPPAAGSDFAFARLQNGASIGFALLRRGDPGPGLAIGEARAAAFETP
jgi:hypothetical protein